MHGDPGPRRRHTAAITAAAAAAAAAFLPTAAATTSEAGAAQLVAAIGVPLHGVPGAVGTFVSRPPAGSPAAVSDTTRPGFPATGPYVVLSTGNALSADDPNTSPKTSADNGGGAVRDGDERDVVVLRIDFTTPVLGCLLTFAYQFLSEEFPEFTSSPFSDAFVAELDLSTWSAVGGTVRAPSAFVIETVGTTPWHEAGATGSTYDGGKPVTGVAQVPIPSSGRHSLYLSLFDLVDNLYDTAVFVDNLVVGC